MKIQVGDIVKYRNTKGIIQYGFIMSEQTHKMFPSSTYLVEWFANSNGTNDCGDERMLSLFSYGYVWEKLS